jgi:apolipoprotein N-acyltransferase
MGGALVSGLGLFLASGPVDAWFLQAICLVPWLWALHRSRSPKRGFLLGAIVGVVPAALAMIWLQLPAAMAIGLVAYTSIKWGLLGALAAWLLRGRPVVAAFAVAGAAVLVEWLNVTVMPVWGTAQAFTRPWAAAPFAMQLVAVVGILGLVFVVVAVQALAIALPGPSGKRAALALVVVIAAAVGIDALGWSEARTGSLKVAAIGWVTRDLAPAEQASDQALIDGVVAPLVERAAAEGARLVVLPETAFDADPRLRPLAERHGVVIVAGYFDAERQQNTAVFAGAPGDPVYHKTHLITGIERYTPGNGAPVLVDVDGVRVGVLICQDDNFTDLARGLALSGAELVVVPTNDWREVKGPHFESSRFRAVENDFAMVRAASNGISAIVSPRGEIVAARDHFTAGAGLVLAEVSIRDGATLYARSGDWAMLALAGLLVLLGVMAVRGAGPWRS